MTEGWRKRQIQMQIPMEDAMTDCPSCEYNKQRAQLWRDEAYKHAGHPLPDREWVGLTDEDFLEACQIAERGNYLVAFQRIQTKLKEKNT